MREYNKVDALVDVRDKLVIEVKKHFAKHGNVYDFEKRLREVVYGKNST